MATSHWSLSFRAQSVKFSSILWVWNHSHIRVYFRPKANWIQMLSANICVCCFDSLMSVGDRNRRQFTLSETPWTSQALPGPFGKQNVSHLLGLFERALCRFVIVLEHTNYLQCLEEMEKMPASSSRLTLILCLLIFFFQISFWRCLNSTNPGK